jgi:hypothetical protein
MLRHHTYVPSALMHRAWPPPSPCPPVPPSFGYIDDPQSTVLYLLVVLIAILHCISPRECILV